MPGINAVGTNTADDVVLVDSVEWKSSQSCRVRIPLNIARMATGQASQTLRGLTFRQSLSMQREFSSTRLSDKSWSNHGPRIRTNRY